jgi:outer membrane protein assembly factor BamB
MRLLKDWSRDSARYWGTVGVLSLAFGLLADSRACADDWPQWRGVHRDAHVTGFKSPATWPTELTRKWQVEVGDGVSTPALVGDNLYVFSRQDGNEIIRCLDASTGSEKWQEKYAAKGADGPASGFAGPRASPTVAYGKVVTLSVNGVVSCFNAADGKLLWRKKDFEGEVPMFYTSSSPLVVDNLCIVQLGGDRDGAMVAYDLTSGDEKWKWADDGTAYASPVLLNVDGTNIVIAETDDHVVGIRAADGQPVWQMEYRVQGRGYNAATPIVDGQTIILTGSNRGAKAVRLEKQGDEFVEKELWTNSDNSVQFNTPVLKDDLIFGLSNRDVLFCINATSGETAWTAPLGEPAAAEPARPPAEERPQGGRGGRGRRGRGGGGYGSIVDVGSALMALTPRSQLIVFEPGNTEFKQTASYKVADGQTYAYPIVSGNRVFVKDQDSVAMWAIP